MAVRLTMFRKKNDLRGKNVKQEKLGRSEENNAEEFDSKTARLVSSCVHGYPDRNIEQLQFFWLREPSQTYKENNM